MDVDVLGSAEAATEGDRMNDKNICNFSTERGGCSCSLIRPVKGEFLLFWGGGGGHAVQLNPFIISKYYGIVCFKKKVIIFLRNIHVCTKPYLPEVWQRKCVLVVQHLLLSLHQH